LYTKIEPKHGRLIKYSEADKGYIVEIYQANYVFIIYVIFVLFILFPTTFIFDVCLSHTRVWNECITIKKKERKKVRKKLWYY
jgi:hypothetical protein